MLVEDYADILTSAIESIARTQKNKIELAADLVKNAIISDGLIYVFGCGHSHILAEETFYRAGGLANVCPIFYEPLMLHESASLSSILEKNEGLGEKLLAEYSFSDNDLLICVSTSGVNAVPVELAQCAKAKGLPVIGISSDEYLAQQPHNRLGRHLQEVCDICIDNCAPRGDACLHIDGTEAPMTPVSTVTGSFIINSVLAEGAKLAAGLGAKVPVYTSGNIPGGAEKNRELIQRYSPRIRYL